MKRMKKSVLACMACLVLIAVACIGWNSHAGAASGALLSVKEINYENSTITLTGNGDSVVYFSNSSAKKWEEAGTFENGECVFDISWVSLSSNYVITFKGDKSDGVLKVTLPKQVTNFKVKYVPNAENPFTFSGDAGRIIEWRKNGVTEWKNWNPTITNDQLAYLKENGATLYFRLQPVNGSGTDAGKRASKEVSVKVSAKKTAPTIKLDASKFTIPLVAKMSYRVLDVDENGNIQENNTAWITVGGSKTYSLSELAPSAMFSGTAKASDGTTKKVALQFKNNATASAQESRIATVIIPAQETVTKEKDGISDLVYVSSKSLEIEVKAASNKDVTYEYCIVDKDNYTAGSLDYTRATWTAMANTKVTLNSTTAKEGSHIYVRKKAKGNPGDENFALASQELELTPANGVAYPAAITINDLIELEAIAGQIDGTTKERTLEFTATSAYANTTVKSIEFKDEYDGDIGNSTVTCTSECTKNPSGDGYIITTKITSTAALDNNEKAWNTPLKAYITLSNGEVIKTTKTNGVTLKLIPPTKVVNPTEADKASYGTTYYKQYTTDFSRIYKSTDDADEKVFKFILEFGSANENTIQKIAYGDNVNIVPTPFTITEGEKVDEKEETVYAAGSQAATVCYENTEKAGKPVRKAYVTIHVNDLESSVKETEVGKRLPFYITLTNGEVLKTHIYMTLVETATASQKRISFSQGSLKEREAITDKNGNISYDGALIDGYQIEVQFSDKLVKIPAIGDVRWNSSDGQSFSIAGKSDGTGSTISVGLENAKLNLLPVGDGDIIITFKNGTSIKAGTISVTAPASKN